MPSDSESEDDFDGYVTEEEVEGKEQSSCNVISNLLLLLATIELMALPLVHSIHMERAVLSVYVKEELGDITVAFLILQAIKVLSTLMHRTYLV